MEPSARYQPITPSSEGVNPYRPYYKPPSIGLHETPGASSSSNIHGSNHSAASTLGSTAREFLPDVNYGGYSEFLGEAAPSTAEQIRALMDRAVWKYSSVFMAQPFEVAKIVLQCRLAESSSNRPLGLDRHPSSQYQSGQGYHQYDEGGYDEGEDEEDDDDGEPAYFTSNTSRDSSRPALDRRPSGLDRRRTDSSMASSPTPRSRRSHHSSHPPSAKLDLRKGDAILEVLSQLWQHEGAWGVWKGTNSTFVYSVLLRTLESWSRGMLAALFNIPDSSPLSSASGGAVGGVEIIDSPFPLASLAVAVAAAGLAGVLLSPLDTIRTKLIVSSASSTKRSLIANLRALPSYLCPSSLFAPTLLHSILPTLVTSSTPLVLRNNFNIDPILTPSAYSVCTFISSVCELFIRLPVETVLRRGQIQALRQASASVTDSSSPLKFDTVVHVGPYYGILPTMWKIAREEGETVQQTTRAVSSSAGINQSQKQPVYVKRKGQGLNGLWRGWRVGMWGLVGVWGASALGGGGKGGEF